MKSKLLFLGLIILPITLCTNAFGQSEKELKLTTIKEKTDINNLQVSVFTDTLQVQSEKGISFRIRIKNDSASAVVIKNPLYIMSYYLLNEQHENVAIREKSKYTIKLFPGNKYNFTAFNIQKIVSKGIELTTMDMANTDTISIPSRGMFEIFINVPQIIKNKDTLDLKDWAGPVTKGKYLFGLSLGLVSKRDSGSLFYSPGSHPISINYGGAN